MHVIHTYLLYIYIYNIEKLVDLVSNVYIFGAIDHFSFIFLFTRFMMYDELVHLVSLFTQSIV